MVKLPFPQVPVNSGLAKDRVGNDIILLKLEVITSVPQVAVSARCAIRSYRIIFVDVHAIVRYQIEVFVSQVT